MMGKLIVPNGSNRFAYESYQQCLDGLELVSPDSYLLKSGEVKNIF